MVVGKFCINSITPAVFGGSLLSIRALYDPNLPEDQKFAQATPNASISMVVTNPPAEDQFKQIEEKGGYKTVFAVFMSEDEYRHFEASRSGERQDTSNKKDGGDLPIPNNYTPASNSNSVLIDAK